MIDFHSAEFSVGAIIGIIGTIVFLLSIGTSAEANRAMEKTKLIEDVELTKLRIRLKELKNQESKQ